MKQFRPLASLVAALPMHLSAGLAALLYSGLVHETSLKTSAVQFVGPLVVVLLAHLAWLASQQELKPGFSMVDSVHNAMVEMRWAWARRQCALLYSWAVRAAVALSTSS